MPPALPCALLHAAALLARAMLLARTSLAARDGAGQLAAELSTLREECQRIREENRLLRARLERLPAARRPRYRPWERFQILWHRARYGLSLRATARAFVLLPETVRRWVEDAQRKRPRLAMPLHPARSLPELVSEVAHALKREQVRWGTRRIAMTLARLGLKGSRSSVQRILHRRPPRPSAPRMARAVRQGPLVARHPNHVWLMDLTEFRMLGLVRLCVGAALDLHSRRVMGIRLWRRAPTSVMVSTMLRRAFHRHGRPRHLVTDRGGQFTARRFRRTLRRHRVRHRYGAVRSSLSVSVMERFWRTFKQERGSALWLFLPISTLQRRALSYVQWYNRHRPHGGLGGATPDEVYSGRKAVPPVVPRRARLVARHLDGDRDLPIYRLAA